MAYLLQHLSLIAYFTLITLVTAPAVSATLPAYLLSIVTEYDHCHRRRLCQDVNMNCTFARLGLTHAVRENVVDCMHASTE